MTKRHNSDSAIETMRRADFEPLEPYISSQNKWKCKCLKCGEIVFPRFGNVKNLKSGCSNCSKGQLNSNKLDAILKKLDISLMDNFKNTKYTHKFACNKCKHIFKNCLRNMQNGLIACPNCRKNEKQLFNYQVDAHYFDSGLRPLVKYVNSHTPRKSRCLSCKRIVYPSYNSVRSGHNGCGYCAKVKIDPKDIKKLLLSKNLKPLEPYQNSHKPLRCICMNCGSEVFPRPNGLKSGQGGCVKCGILKRAKSRKLSEVEAVKIMLDASLKPLEKYRDSKTPWKSICLKCNKVVKPKFNTVQSGDGGCKFCGKNFVDPKEAKRLAIARGFIPQESYKNSNSPWLVKHKKCGNLISPSYTSIKNRLGGCKFCAKKGFQFSSPGYVYLMFHTKLNAGKIGIGNIGIQNDRLEIHKKQGWELFKLLNFDDGNQAYELEQSLLNWLRKDLKIPVYLSTSDMPQRGETETFELDQIKITKIWRKVTELNS